MKISSEAGMTVKELVVSLGLIALIFLVSIPAFFYLKKLSRVREYDKTIELVQSGLSSWNVKSKMLNDQTPFPPFLDHDPEGSSCVKCFDLVTEKGIADILWFKEAQNVYLFAVNGKTADAREYAAPGNRRLTYRPESGKIDSEVIP